MTARNKLRRLGRSLASTAAVLTAWPAAALVGHAVRDDAFAPHVVMVLNRGVGRAGFCTGVVVTPRVVLTAAHCAVAAENMRIHYRDESGAPQLIEIQAVATHPRFHADAVAKRIVSIDLALVRVKTPLASRFTPARLDEASTLTIGQPLRIFGFGVAREGDGSSAGVLRGGDLTIRAPLSSILVWADDSGHAGAGACTGDSGGPIVLADSDRVVAITAWSAGENRESHCGALTQGVLIAPQAGWIDEVLRQWGER
jgi:Trypsin